MFLTAIASAYVFAQSNTIYKCVNEAEQITFSQQPCKKGDKAQIVKQRSRATQSNTGIAPIDQARNARTPPPAFSGECAGQVNNLKVTTDQGLFQLAEQHRTQTAAQVRVVQQLQDAQGSLVGDQWRAELENQQSQIIVELRNIEATAKQIVESEAAAYQQLRGSCREAPAR
jgi:hypothetical protein